MTKRTIGQDFEIVETLDAMTGMPILMGVSTPYRGNLKKVKFIQTGLGAKLNVHS